MLNTARVPSSVTVAADLQDKFLSLLPRIRLHAHIYFRHIRCRNQKEDYIAEAVALAWHWFLRLERRGKDVATFVSALASYAARAANNGRRLTGRDRAKDVFSPMAPRRRGFAVQSLPERSTLYGNAWDEALRDNVHSDVAEQVCFRCDFPRWRGRYRRRLRRLIDDLMRGERPLDVARKYRISPARISQLRRAFHDDWGRFCADPAEA